MSKKYLRTKEEKELYKRIINHVEYSANAEKNRRKRWEDVWRLWTQEKNPDMPRFRSNTRLPIARTAVNTFAAFLSAKEPTWNVYPIGEEDWLKAQLSRELLQYQAKKSNILDLRRKAKVWIKSACLFDVGIIKATWKTVTTKDENGKTVVLYDYPCIENVHAFDFYPDPYINSVQGQQMVVEHMVIPLEELKANPNYKIPSDYKATYNDGRSDTNNSSILNSIDLQTSQGDEETQGKVEAFEVYTKSMVYTLIDPYGQPFFAQQKKNKSGRIPYVKMDFEVEPVPNRFYGYGMITPNIDLNKAIDAMLNNIRDNVNILINPMYKIRRGSRIDPRQLVSRPGGSIDVESLGDIDQLRTADTTGSGYQMFNLLNGLYQTGTRVQAVRGGGAGTADTATEAEIQQSNADVITNAVKDNFEQALSELGTMILKLNIENMQGNTSLRIFNPELIEKMAERFLPDQLTEDQKIEALTTKSISGYELDDDMLEEIKTYGMIKPEPMSQEDEDRIKTYGELIKYSKEFINVDADVIVEADSTLKKDSAVLRKQVSDIVNIIARLPNGEQRIDWDVYSKTMADLTGIPALKKLIKAPEPVQPPMMLPEGEQGMPNAEGRPPAVDELNSNQAIMQSIRNV